METDSRATDVVQDRMSAPGAATIRSPAARLTLQLEHGGQECVVRLAGELDLETAPELDRHLAGIDGTQVGRVLIDLREVTFMDSSGLASIIRALRSSQSNGHDLVLRRGSDQVQRIFELTGVDARLTFEDGEL